MTRPLLVIAHAATRSGAPRVLIDLLRYAQDRISAPVAIRLLARGSLSHDLEALATAPDTDQEPQAALANGASAASELLRLDRQVPAMAYVHEEGSALDVLPAACWKALRERCKRVLCVSERSAADLQAMGVKESAISILPPVVTDPSPHVDREAMNRLQDRIGDDNRALVIGCGEADWRKGADLFIDVARRVLAERPVRFAWAGRRPRAFARLLDNDTRVMGINDDLTWLGELADVADVFEMAELLVMTSREDPQPLVPLEAAGLGTATVGFSVGGVADLAANAAAATVTYPDTVALAAQVVALLDAPASRERLAARALQHRIQNHSIEVLGPRFVAEIETLINRDAPPSDSTLPGSLR